jgi:L-xylulokinase
MMPNILIGVDMGSSSLKALALEAGSGRAIALSRMPLPHDRLAGGGCEVRAAAIRAALTHVLRDVAHQLGPRAAEVRAMACTGHGAGLYALDANNELVGGRAVASTDQRADARARTLAKHHGARLFEDVGCGPWPGQPTVIAAELLGADAVQRGELRRLLFAKDYLGFLLTGEIATDASDASTAGLVSLATGAGRRSPSMPRASKTWARTTSARSFRAAPCSASCARRRRRCAACLPAFRSRWVPSTCSPR